MAKSSLIIAIVNAGCSDLVMLGAKENGATGGTYFKGKGTGNPELEKFYGIEIKPEKEIVLIVVDNKIKEKVLKGIYKTAGLDTNGQGIVFAVPVDNVVVRKNQLKK